MTKDSQHVRQVLTPKVKLGSSREHLVKSTFQALIASVPGGTAVAPKVGS